jgi:hypothetical protein
VFPAKKPTSPRVFAAIGIAAVLATLGIALGVWWSIQTPSPVAQPNADIPVFTTLEDSLAYYEGEKTAARAFVEEHPFGYDFERVESVITNLDPKVQAEAEDAAPDLEAIAGWGYDIRTLIGGFEQAVDRWETTYTANPDLTTNASGTEAEAALDEVSGGVSDIVFDDFCGDPESALACVSGGTLVHVPLQLENLSNAELTAEYGDFWMSVMGHEFGHVIQNKYINRLLADPDYQRLFVDIEQPPDADDFDVDLEYSADCMGAALIPDYVLAYLPECTPEQLAFAATIWDGSFYEG